MFCYGGMMSMQYFDGNEINCIDNPITIYFMEIYVCNILSVCKMYCKDFSKVYITREYFFNVNK